MSIRINIPSTTCRAGATVAGTVSLHGDVDIDVEIITISLVGRCKTKVIRSNGNSSTTYRGRAPLLEYRQVLFKGPNTMKTNGHSWPFSFTFPTHCVGRGADPFKQRHGLFDINSQQSLPPSFASANVSFGWSGVCFVKYELEASLVGNRTKIFSLGDLKSEKSLDFTTTRDIETFKPDFIEKSQKIACYSLRLQPDHGDGPLTFKEKLQSMRTSKLPVAMFQLHMFLPKVGILTHPLPLILKIEHDIESSTAQALPIVTLRKCIVELQAYTYIQCIRDEIFRDGDEQRDWSNDFHIASVDYSANMDKAPPVTECMDLQKLMRIKVPWHHRPTFSTFNIRRTYRLVPFRNHFRVCGRSLSHDMYRRSPRVLLVPRPISSLGSIPWRSYADFRCLRRLAVKLSVDCAQKTFKTEFTSYKFDLLAADYASPSQPATEQETAAPAYGDLSGQLPTYQDAKAASRAIP